MKILVLGGTGVIGSKLVEYMADIGNEVEYTYLTNKMTLQKGHKLKITQMSSTIDLITKINPDLVIHTVALTNVDLCETNNTLADSIHIDGTKNVIEGCKITKSKLVYVSTCFVFDGKKKQYIEEDTTSPATYYGYTKLEGEKLVANSSLRYLILRTDQPYCWTEKWQHTNSLLRVIHTLQSGKILREVIDWYNTPTYVPDFVEAAHKLLEYNLTGIFHLVGSDFVNRYDFSLKVAEVFGLNRDFIKPIKSDVLKLPAKRVNVNLSNKKLEQKTGVKMKGFTEGLIEMYKTRNHSMTAS